MSWERNLFLIRSWKYPEEAFQDCRKKAPYEWCTFIVVEFFSFFPSFLITILWDTFAMFEDLIVK